MIDAGTLNRRVTIQAPATGQDEIGQPAIGWVDVATVWANVRHPNGAEAIRANKETATTAASIRIRHRSDVSAANRIIADAAAYEVRQVLPDASGREFIDLVCEAVRG